ncbi:MAG: Asp-tRNA(Asn)/Glu-tRNA(Gln) amidotransferase subunit GatB [Proteobacteria bacterium]|nr:Asp-tRNA(Asn)/Glu-tRNA(Gln) amidotransferase subunit GatB [Pseudomonadota bacterium]
MTAEPHPHYEVVIGLEVHVHLKTESKLFSPAPVVYGQDPNHAVHSIDLGLPGVLPVLNRRAVELAIRAGLATHCEIHPRSVFSRKNYFYPDLPKGYQISQYEEPIATGGFVDVEIEGEEARRVRLTRIHIEEDAGKSIHDATVVGDDDTHVDLNRAGVPLVEIVSEPDMRSPAEAAAYLRTLRDILRAVDVSEADMEKGQFRCDANVSLRPKGTSELGTRTELKNLNSFRFVEAAIEAEIERQADVLDEGGQVVQCTMGFDPETQRVRVQRVKENADDYRYFDDPDLIPLELDPALIERIRASLPELPADRRRRFSETYGLSEYDARLLTASRPLADYFEEAARIQGNAKTVANWMLRDVLQTLKEREIEVGALALDPPGLAQLIGLVESGRLTAKSARELFQELARTGGDPETLMRERGLEAVSDAGLIERTVDEVLAAHPEAVETYRGGDQKVQNFLMGQVMKRTQGKANPAEVRRVLASKLSG